MMASFKEAERLRERLLGGQGADITQNVNVKQHFAIHAVLCRLQSYVARRIREVGAQAVVDLGEPPKTREASVSGHKNLCAPPNVDYLVLDAYLDALDQLGLSKAVDVHPHAEEVCRSIQFLLTASRGKQVIVPFAEFLSVRIQRIERTLLSTPVGRDMISHSEDPNAVPVHITRPLPRDEHGNLCLDSLTEGLRMPMPEGSAVKPKPSPPQIPWRPPGKTIAPAPPTKTISTFRRPRTVGPRSFALREVPIQSGEEGLTQLHAPTVEVKSKSHMDSSSTLCSVGSFSVHEISPSSPPEQDLEEQFLKAREGSEAISQLARSANQFPGHVDTRLSGALKEFGQVQAELLARTREVTRRLESKKT